MKNKITVELCDKEYSLLWDEPEEYVHSLAVELNKMIDTMAYNNMRISKADAAVLTCLDICDKNRKLTENNDNMRKQIMLHVDEIASLNKKILAYERQKSPKTLKNMNIEPDDTDEITDDNPTENANTDETDNTAQKPTANA